MDNNNIQMPATLHPGFVGAGRMAQALVSGIAASALPINGIYFIDPSDDAARRLEEIHPESHRCQSMDELAGYSDSLWLAVKPQSMQAVLPELASAVSAKNLVVSVAAGVSIQRLQSELNTTRIVRVMPNTPCLIGQGMSAMACHRSVTDTDRNLVRAALESVGQVVQVDESVMDAVTGLSGSGPAYVFTFVEALIEGGTAMGLAPDIARQLTLQTLRGAVALLETTKQSPDELRRQVTSPGGTTLAGLEVLQQHAFSSVVQNAVAAATDRSRQLSG